MRSILRALRAQSVASRLFLSAAFWSASILIVAGLGLSALNARSAESSFDGELDVYLKALVANVAISEETHSTSPPVIAPQFELAFSGWYWQITRLDHDPPEIRTSRSLFGSQLPRFDEPAAGKRYRQRLCDRPRRQAVAHDRNGDRRRRRGPLSDPGRRQRRGDPDPDRTVRIRAGGDLSRCSRSALIGSTALAVRFGLQASAATARGLAAIRRGEKERIVGEFPGGRRAARRRDQPAARRQPRGRRARAHPGRQPRPRAEDAAQRHRQRGGGRQPAARARKCGSRPR